MEKRSRSGAFTAAANHWANKKPKKEHPDVVDVSSGVSNGKEQPPQEMFTSPFRLIYNPTFEGDEDALLNKDTIMISSLVGTKDLKETYQFNFCIDVDFFLSFLHPDFSKFRKPITFITGDKLLKQQPEEVQQRLSNYNASEIVAHVPDRFGTHHTKMMINFYEDDTVEVVIMTCNFTKLDFLGLTQMCWTTGRLPTKSRSGSVNSCSNFLTDLQKYLCKYKNGKLNALTKTLDRYDFQSITVELVASSPGTYDISEVSDTNEIYGYGKFLQVLQRNGLLLKSDTRVNSSNSFNVLAQVSSIAYPYAILKGKCASIFTHILCPILFCNGGQDFSSLYPGEEASELHQASHNYTPHIVFPTVQEVTASNVGISTGTAIHYEYRKSSAHRAQHEQNVKRYLRRWSSKTANDEIVTGREKIPPHVKLYMCDNADNFKTLRWALLCSHNLSKQAWGVSKGPASKKIIEKKYDVANFELGVFVPAKNVPLVPVYGSDSPSFNHIPIRLPFTVPPQAYQANEMPWSSSQI